ncbi:FixH family protein [Halalkalibacter akibai]|uniref:YtkA-like domain-containing protein n=1 Tax=Halalkalibacter akibai (strain ATCC 43226 / DSM 21942 / CIP 109018 / JCM 9157 / 1139) TaxID=1236973 RepID=W4QR50_HALA3|nr:FixH family protein [Halalkalibacter akibai]GAE33819.1 hypothetical protein JCM9157_845 [Halalkalibacter akibai JCM 9157]
MDTECVGIYLAITACGNEPEIHIEESENGVIAPIDVELNLPETAEVGETVTFVSVVTQADEQVDDANEVVYEIWLEGQKELSELIEIENQDGNSYYLDYTFSKEGLYHVQSHVTARGLHRMPTGQVLVGTDAEASHKHEEEHNDTEHEHDHVHDHQHQHANVHIDSKLESNRLIMEIEVDGEPFTGGRVTLEMRNTTEENVHWLDMEEIGNGSYELSTITEYNGTYSTIVHIEDEEIHEHIKMEIQF